MNTFVSLLYPPNPDFKKSRWTFALFCRNVWEMLGRPVHFADFKRMYGDELTTLYNNSNMKFFDDETD